MTTRTKTILYTVVAMFFVTAATTFLAGGGDLWALSTADLHAIVNASIGAVLTFLIGVFGPPVARTVGIMKPKE